MIPVTPRSFFNRSQDLQNMENSNNNTVDTHRAESSFHGGRIARAKSCVIGYASVTTVSSSAVRTGAKSDRMKSYGTLCSIPRDMRRNYRSVVVAADRVPPPVSLSIKSPDSGFSRSGSMQTCLESNFHRSVPARGTPLEPRDGGSEFYSSERFSRVRQGHAVNRRNVRNRTNTLTTLSVAGSSVILSDYDSSLRLCQSCNTFYEVAATATCLPYQEPDVPTTICNVFWKLYLTLSPFVCGGVAVEYGSLWPSEPGLLDSLLLETCSTSSSLVQTLSRDIVLCGPLHILKALLNLNIISINQTFDNGFSLLHVACIAQNSSAVTYLTKAGIDATIRDNQGCTAAQVCCSPHIYALLPNAYLASSVPPKVKRSAPTMLEKQTIFEMARNPEDTERLLAKLQILKFDVNKEMDNSGDLIIHVVIKEGLAQIPLLLLLVRLFNADVNIRNKSGLTCLMLASSMGSTVLVDVLLCVLGADPNLRCHEKRWTALHYASYEQHLETIDVLLKRGSDFNVEDENGARPDDVAMRCGAHDCRDAIEKKRQELIQRMKTIVKGNELDAVKGLRVDDLFIVNNTGHTLIMWAVKQGSLDILEFLLNQTNFLQQSPGNEKAKKERPSLINAQAQKTLRTALAMAVIHRRKEAVQLLFRFGANPSIHDVQKLLPLHHAIINRDIEMVDTLLQHTSALTGLKKALDMSENDEITVKVKSAMNRRQNLIVNHELFEHSVSGNTNRLFCVLEDGDDVNPVTGVGDWPLYLAAVNGHLDVIRLLMERGGDFWSVHSSDGNTVLHVSCANSHEEIVEYLLMTYRATTTPGATTPEGRLSALLTEHLNLLNFKGRTPLMLAAETGNIDLVRLLLDHGASTSVLTPDGQLYRCDQFDGVQHILEQHHKRHCVEVFEAIANKKGGYQRLKDLFLPNHDHNLRHPSSGDAPLMTAARLGRLDVLRHLLGSASYTLFRQPGPRESSEAETTVGGLVIISDDDFIDGWDEHPVTPTDATAAAAADVENGKLKDARTAADGLMERGEENGDNVATVDENLSALLEGMNSVCQVNPVLSGNKISQTCAVNTFDKCTVYHRGIESGDSVVMLHCLLEGADQSAVNMQDMRGFSPLHLAVQLNRKKVVQKLTQLRYVDLNCRALDGALPEDLTTNKTIKSLVLRARSQQDVTAGPRWPLRSVANSVSGADRSISYASDPVNFERLNNRFAKFKENCAVPSMLYS